MRLRLRIRGAIRGIWAGKRHARFHFIHIPKNAGRPWMGPLSSWFNQLVWLRDESGIVAYDCLRMEQLDEDLPAYLDRPIELARKNATSSPYDYREMYTDELAEIVAAIFREYIEHFGSAFEGPATNKSMVRA